MAAFYTEADYENSVIELFRDNMDYLQNGIPVKYTEKGWHFAMR